jgi:hypothetical protein
MKKIITFLIAPFLLNLVACDKFLDKNPDSRVELDTAEKVQKFLVSAYPSVSPAVLTEFSSDNIDDIGANNRYTLPFIEEIVYWKDFHEYGNRDGLRSIWNDSYSSIYHANLALEAIGKLPDSPRASAAKGEALVARAYAHFVLVNLFGKHYNTTTSSTDLGVAYVDAPITEFRAQRPRNTVAEVYQRIEQDLTEGLALINDSYYSVPKFHFTKKAAQAFAARFYLYKENWVKAEEMATAVLGETIVPSVLRNWSAFQSLLPGDPHAKEFSRDDVEANILLTTIVTKANSYIDETSVARFTHGAALASRETFLDGNNLWGGDQSAYKDKPYVRYRPEISKYTFTKYPKYANSRSQVALFNSDEILLIRAEARILQSNYTGALSDLNLFTSRYLTVATAYTQSDINTAYDRIASSSYDTTTKLSYATQKKALHPAFTIPSGAENMIHYLLQCRRLLTLGEGLRWYDIRRYGIEVYRHQLDNEGNAYVKEVLTPTDNRRTLPLPVDVVAAGLEQNPR